MANTLAALSTEQRAELQAKARMARSEKVAQRRASKLRQDFDDAHEWERLARRAKVRMAPWGEAPARASISKFLHAVGRAWPWFYEQSGYRTPGDFAALNPDWPMRALCGLILEWVSIEEPARFASVEQAELEMVP